MAFTPVNISLPSPAGLMDFELIPKFNVKNGLFEFYHDKTRVAVGISLHEAQDALDRWAREKRLAFERAAEPRAPVLIVRHASGLEYGLKTRMSHSERHPPEHLVAFSVTPAFRSSQGVLYQNSDGENRCEGGQRIIPDTAQTRDITGRITERMARIAGMVSEIIDDKPFSELPLAIPNVPALCSARMDGHLVKPDVWDVPPQKEPNGVVPRGAKQMGTVKHVIHEPDEIRTSRTFRILLDETTGSFFIKHPKTFKVPGQSSGRSLEACKRTFDSNVEEHNARTVFEDGRHLLCLRKLVTETARNQGLEREFPSKTPAPDFVVALTHEHVWSWAGLFWRPAWSDYASVHDLKTRGQVNVMRADSVSKTVTYVDWSPDVEAKIVDAEQGIQRINEILETAIQNDFVMSTRNDSPHLLSPNI